MHLKRNKFLKLSALIFAFVFSESCITTIQKTEAPKVVEKQIQLERWQQKIDYKIDVDFNHLNHQYTGNSRIVFTNNSPDALDKAFFHLYNNAFKPESSMDVRSRTIADADPRVADRISKLKPDEIGFTHVKALTLNGKPCRFKEEETILEVVLPEKIQPNSSVTFELSFDGQVPIQVRRNGRMSKEGVDYSMAQWYPKLCNYDEQGWHANPYVGREFYGIWGDFDVKILIDEKYTVGGTGILQNAAEIGKGYAENAQTKPVNGKLKWHFVAKNVHDFMWGADPDYRHTQKKAADGTNMHFFYIPSEKTSEWDKLPNLMAQAFDIIGKRYGKYAYTDYTFIQGGDGGMEYPMATLITGERNLISLTGVAVHELMHNWFQGVLATNESLYGWMDEGFTSHASNVVMNDLKKLEMLPGQKPEIDPIKSDVLGFCRWTNSGGEKDPLSTHADHFQTNTNYSISSYTKGSVCLQQLKYIVGENNYDTGMKAYYDTWKFRHPNATDFFRVHENISGLELDWFKEYWVYSIHKIDYSVATVSDEKIVLKRLQPLPMPLDVTVTYANGSKELFYIPLDIMRGEKPNENAQDKRTVLKDWTWTFPEYSFKPNGKVIKVEIDASVRLADVKRENNVWELDKK
jgi:hypothetical protein